ncbi:sigma-70 family RNA polymerase sigma factor [Leifsonia sp. PS1209]|uniref:sigma-70 family RNA polymerase sigma factor n=1 Tax=Leifsonia sp. PS1209 TaxID=2724914 RepID=UPI001442CE73|nr:sigma-70 family RNA polymerase sigma factor [Leifsonia sp. PS1209]QIZ99564.1 sigma-70 family RNA polymerase sigma factor [Leifsonia sp. PS1209]
MPPVTEQSDSDLVELTRGGNREAFAELWRRHARAAMTVARSHTSTFDADDLVSEAYAKIYRAIAAGGGPTTAFRAYLFSTVRNIAASWGRARHETAFDEMESVEDPAFSEAATMEALDRSLTAKAFHTLPSRWQEVLWYCEVESMTPQQVAPLFGMTPNAVAALAYRAREGLRQAWVQAHLASTAEGSECRWTTERLGAYARHGLGKRDTAAVDAHLAECARCSIVASEASEVGSRLSLVLLPLTLGIGGAAAYAAWMQSGANAVSYAIGESGAVMPGSAAPGAGGAGSGSAGGSGSGAATAAPATATAAAGTGSTVGIGLTIGGLLVAAAVAAGFVFGPQLFPQRPASVTASQQQPDTGAATAPPVPAPAAPLAADPAPAAPAPSVPAPAVPVVAAPQPAAPSTGNPPSTAPVAVSPGQTGTTPTEPSGPGTPGTPTPTTPPAAPAVSSPAQQTETNAATLAASGTAAPDARIVVSATPATASPLSTASSTTTASTTPAVSVGNTTADRTGAWSLTLDLSSLTDGDWSLGFVQATAGGSSPAQTTTVSIDRTAIAPLFNEPDTGSDTYAGLLAPIVSGTAEPGATVDVYDRGTLQATVTASADGTWATDPLTGVQPAFAITARQTDRLGNVSAVTAPLTGSVAVPAIRITPTPGHSFLLTVDGAPGATLRLSADGNRMQNLVHLDAYGHASQGFEWALDDTLQHRFGVAYTDGSRYGLLVDLPVTLF